MILMQEQKKKGSCTAIIIVFVYAVVLVLFTNHVFYARIAPNLPEVVVFLYQFVVFWILLIIPTILFMRRDKMSLADIGFTKKNAPIQLLIGVIWGILSI